jgi:hypothetical protein
MHVAASWRRWERGSDDLSLAKVEDKPQLGRVAWWAEHAEREVV